ncbi:hypothetical protein SCLCIDRAFT_443736 [Scleroderma citrinum Foug A]|uniref:Uncharacterized protein n=1 Tax=Scleroderma citrinum Foug A TaxID=1036808 RepID=A0A0C2ZW24_9AGAM|nr:hypothetical protein SCLCIDRAFT_443736 [Scleroderma citrinum Foug A]
MPFILERRQFSQAFLPHSDQWYRWQVRRILELSFTDARAILWRGIWTQWLSHLRDAIWMLPHPSQVLMNQIPQNTMHWSLAKRRAVLGRSWIPRLSRISLLNVSAPGRTVSLTIYSYTKSANGSEQTTASMSLIFEARMGVLTTPTSGSCTKHGP